MIEQEMEKVDFSQLGFWGHFAFVRFLFLRIKQLEKENYALKDLLVGKMVEEKLQLTPVIKESNNIAVPVISETDDRDENFYQRRPDESIESFLERIGTYKKPDQPVTKTVRSASDLIEDARKAHLKVYTDQLEEKEKSKNIIVSDRAVDRIGNEIAATQGQ